MRSEAGIKKKESTIMTKYRPRFSAACTSSQYIIGVWWILGFWIFLEVRLGGGSWRRPEFAGVPGVLVEAGNLEILKSRKTMIVGRFAGNCMQGFVRREEISRLAARGKRPAK